LLLPIGEGELLHIAKLTNLVLQLIVVAGVQILAIASGKRAIAQEIPAHPVATPKIEIVGEISPISPQIVQAELIPPGTLPNLQPPTTPTESPFQETYYSSFNNQSEGKASKPFQVQPRNHNNADLVGECDPRMSNLLFTGHCSLVTVEAIPPGTAPSLQPQRTTPTSLPFQPQNLPLLPVATEGRPRYLATPGITVITPSAYGKSWGDISIGLGLQARTRFTNEPDGVLGVGFGLGDEQKYVGLDVGVTITDLLEAPGQDGTVSFKLHRQLPAEFRIAVGVQNALNWGNTDGGRSIYGVVTKRFNLQERIDRPLSQVFISAGVGSGQFRSEFDIQSEENSINFFGSVAVRAIEPVSVIAEWTGQDLTLGISAIPFQNIPLVITPAVTDITGKAGDGARFLVGVGYLITF
jgi:hypothetical protein